MTLSNREKERLLSKYGSWAVVTGASSGIGLELTTLLASAGFNLVICARSQETLSKVSRQLSDEFGVQISTVPADLSTSDGIAALIKSTDGLEVRLLIQSAGFGTSGPFLSSSLHTELNLIKLNNEALLHLTHHFAQVFSAQSRGGIILLSSMVGFQGVPNAANYAASKAYVQSLGEALYEELKPHGVDVLATAPGPVESGFGQRANMQMSMSLTPQKIGVPILKALGRKSTNLPGILTKFLVYALRTVPRRGKVKIMAKVMGGMTAHQR